MNKPTITNSNVSSWLASIIYPANAYLLLPTYFGRIEVTGQENIPHTGPVIIAPTHRSRWDALIIPYATGKLVSGRYLRFMVSANEVKGLQGWFIKRLGGFPVDTDSPGASSVRHSVQLLSAGEMLVIFPEGGIFRDDQVHRLKKGVAHIALEVESENPKSSVKILPISIRYSEPYPHWNCTVKVKIGSPLNTANYRSNLIKQSTDDLTHALTTTLQQLHNSP